MDILQETILRYVNGRHTSKCIELNCPCCVYMGEARNDTKGRGGLFLEHTTTGYNCFNCGFKFKQDTDKPLTKKVKTFLSIIGADNAEIQKIMFVYRKNASDNPFSDILFDKKKKTNRIDLNFTETALPEKTHLLVDLLDDIDETHPAFKAYTYAHERGIERNPYLMWSSSTRNKLNEYLIIPFIYGSKIVGYQARYFGDDEWIKQYKRFINSDPNQGKYVYGIENVFSDNQYLIVNESLIDSYIYNGVGLMSHNINQNQIDVINRFKGTVIMVPDFGTGSKQLIDASIDNGWGVYFPFWDDGKDLGQATDAYGKLFMTQHIINHHTKSQSTIQLKRKTLL